MALPWAAIGGIAGALGSIFGGSDDDQPQVTKVKNEVNYQKMARAAARAGFNPLTALRNGGAAGFGTQTTTMPAMSSQSTVSRIADGVGAFAQGMDNQQRWDAAQVRANLENEMIATQIRTLQTPTTGPIGGGLSSRPPGGGSQYPGTGTPGTTGGNPPPSWLITRSPEGTDLMGPNPDNQSDMETELWWQTKRHVVIDESDKLIRDNLDNSKTWHKFNDFLWGPPDPDGNRKMFRKSDSPGFYSIPDMWKDFSDWWEGGSTLPPNPLQQPRSPIRIQPNLRRTFPTQ